MNSMTYPQGCLSAAWQDIKSSPGWFGRLLVLGLIMCVPVLNFVVAGYLLLWAREVPLGGRTPLPQKMVSGQTFEMGFYGFVISLAAGFAGGVVSGILGLIPFLGALVSLACMLAIMVAVPLMQMRMIMAQRLGAGFDVADEWRAAQASWGQLLVIALVPNLIAGAVVSVISIIIVTFFVLLGMGGAMPMLMGLSSPDTYASADAFMFIGTLLSVGFVGFVVIYVLGCVVSVYAEAITIRAMGHWVARYAPEWTALPYPSAPSTYAPQPQQPPMYQQQVYQQPPAYGQPVQQPYGQAGSVEVPQQFQGQADYPQQPQPPVSPMQ